MHQPSHLLEAKQEKQMRIPKPPEMPEPESRTDTPVCLSSSCITPLRTLRNASLNPTQNQNHRSNCDLGEEQTKRMRQILRKQSDQRSRQSQITQCDKLKHPASRPRRRKLASHPFTKSNSIKCNGVGSAASLQHILLYRNRIISLLILISLKMTHARNPAFARPTCNSCSLFSARCVLCALCVLCVNVFSFPHRKTAHSFRRAMRAKSFDGFTAAGFPTISSIHLSFALSPYAKHRGKSKSSASAIRWIARAFASPNIASPTIRPVHVSFFTSSRVAQTRIALRNPRASNSTSIARAARCAKGSSVPLTITSRCPRCACHTTRSTASGKSRTGILACRRLFPASA